MKKLFINFFIFLLMFNTSLAEDRGFQPVAKSKNTLGLLDYFSIKQGEGDEIKYIQLISYKNAETLTSGTKYKSLQMYKKGKCKENMNLTYIIQAYDVNMDDGNVMKGTIVKTITTPSEWKIDSEKSLNTIILREACKNYEIQKIAEEIFKERSKKK
ncbi:hypothetical protein N9M72_01320 [Candidatus Pelagibacter bacterium]|nr:hypothetical protein [Candidatus Pelagibacter bacterium]